MNPTPKILIEVVLIKRINLKQELKKLFSFGIEEIFEFFDMLGKHQIEVDAANKVYHVKYKRDREVSRNLLPLTVQEFKALLSKKMYKDANYKYIFMKKTLKYFEI